MGGSLLLGPCAWQRAYRHRRLDALDVAFVHKNFACASAQSLDLRLLQVLAALQALNLVIKISHGDGLGFRDSHS